MSQNSRHTNNTQQSGSSKCSGGTVEVYAPDTKTLYTVPREHISHQGLPSDKGRLLVCRTYCNAIESGTRPCDVTACAMGNQCRFVHINVPLTQLKGDVIHVHYVYRNEDCCSYESLSDCMTREHADVPKSVIEDFGILVHGPNNREPVESIPTTRLLLTGGSRYAFECATNPKRFPGGEIIGQPRVCHCAHYYFTQTCNRGANCSFIHVISTDPSQKADSIKPANYRRRVAQLGQVEVPQGHMGSPQIQYHSNAPSVQGTPVVGAHVSVGGSINRQLNISVGMNNLSPNTFNQETPVTVGRTPGNQQTHQSRSSPSLVADLSPAVHRFESNNNSTTAYNSSKAPAGGSSVEMSDMEAQPNRIVCGSSSSYSNSYADSCANAASAATNPPHPLSATSSAPPLPPSRGYLPAESTTSPLTAGYGHSPYTTPHHVHHHSSSARAPYISAVGNTSTSGASHVQSATTMTTMLPMDDVVDGCFDTQSTQSRSHGSPSSPYYTKGAYNHSLIGGNMYSGGAAFSLNNNAADMLQHSPLPMHSTNSNGGYASSAQCSPSGTPSTGMHKLATPKVAAGRYVHNPYAQSPVTAQAQI